MKRREWLSSAAALATLAFLVAPGAASPLPGALQKLQEQAPEQLHIKVLAVDTSVEDFPYRSHIAGSIRTAVSILLKAQVETVIKSSSGVNAGTVIEIRYSITNYAPPESRPPGGPEETLLAVGQTVTAYLKQQGTQFRLAASGARFVFR
jgi:hypothetical protein